MHWPILKQCLAMGYSLTFQLEKFCINHIRSVKEKVYRTHISNLNSVDKSNTSFLSYNNNFEYYRSKSYGSATDNMW